MRAEVYPREDTTTLYLRWEVIPEGGELKRLEALGGPLVLAIGCTHYVDAGGKFHDHAVVDVPVFPHAGQRNFGQAKFTDHEARRSFWELLQETVIHEITTFVHEADAGSVDVEGHVIRVGAPEPTSAEPSGADGA